MTNAKSPLQRPIQNFEKNSSHATFERYLGYDIKILRIAGLYSIDSVFTDKTKNSTNWEAVAFGVGIMHIFFVASCEFRTIVRVWQDDPNYAIGVFTAMFSGILCAVKVPNFFSSLVRRPFK